MKIRNGFVSNSSSSSFLLGCTKENKIVGGRNIVDYIREHEDAFITLNLGDLNEGDDIFELTHDMKRLILRFPEEFINGVSHLYEYKDIGDDWKRVPFEPVAYVDSVMRSNDYCSFYPEDEDGVTEEDLRKDILKRIPDAEIEQVYVDNNACNNSWNDELSEFASRYFTESWDGYYTHGHSRGWSKLKPHAYGIAYSYSTRDKKEAMEYILDPERNLKCLIARNNVIFDTIYQEEREFECVDLDLWEVGEKNRETLRKNIDKFMGGGEIIFYYNADIIDEATKERVTVGQRRLDMYFGRASETLESDNARGFKSIFLAEEERY